MLTATGCAGLATSSEKFQELINPRIVARRMRAKQQKRYQIDRDPKAMRWLLAHEISTGMSVNGVNEIFGQMGDRQYDDSRYKSSSRSFRRTDEVFRWGPDSDGSSVFLVFRDDHLVNFDPEEYRSSE